MSTAVAKIQPAPQQVAVSDLKEMSLNYLAMPQVYNVMWQLAEAMSRARSMPKHLKDNPGDCFRIIEFANRIGQSPFALADSSFEVSGKIGYDGKAIAAMVNANPRLEGHLRYDYAGTGEALEVTVSGRLRGEAQERQVSATLKLGISDSKGARDRWVKDPEQMLGYYGARRWARRHTPEVILGMYTYDELRAGNEGGSIIDITPTEPEPHDPATGEVRERAAGAHDEGRRHTEEPRAKAPTVQEFWTRDSFAIRVNGHGWQKWQDMMNRAIQDAATTHDLDRLLADNRASMDRLAAEVPRAAEALRATAENAALILHDNEQSIFGEDEDGRTSSA